MIVSAHQPAYLPWLGYFHKILLCDTFVLMDDVQFEKNSFTNRNQILSAGQKVMLTIPVRTKGHLELTVADIEVSDHAWRRKHLKTIEQAYRKSPQFESVFPIIAAALSASHRFLIDYTGPLLTSFLDYLEIKTKIRSARELVLKQRKLDYVIELTKIVGGDMFVFGALGKEYADEDLLRRENVTPFYQGYRHPTYSQLSREFVPNLSVVDLLFNEPPQRVQEIILSGNVSKEELLSTATRK